METEFNLSEKIIVLKAELSKTIDTEKPQRYASCASLQDMGVSAQDVKEFIRLLKEETEWTQTKGQKLGMITEEQIDKLAGDKLNGN